MDADSLEQLGDNVHTLQILQALLPQHARASTLDSAARLVHTLCQEFGAATTLEEVIQNLVGKHLQAQVRTCRSAC